MSHSREYAGILLRKAAQDELVLEKLGHDPAVADEVIGFHAQQAIEKMLKAVLSFHAIRYRRTHDLVELIDLLLQNSISFPAELEDAAQLGPFAVALRYDELPSEPEPPLDRVWATDRVREIRKWAESIVVS